MKAIGKEPVRKLMRRRFPKITSSDTVEAAAKKFSKTDLNAIPVFTRNKFVGELHERDLLNLAIDVHKIAEFKVVRSGMAFFAKKVSDLMTEHDDTISPNAPVSEAALMMLSSNDSIVAVKEKKKLVGIIVMQDIVNKLVK